MKNTSRRSLEEQEKALADRLAKVRAAKKQKLKSDQDRARREQNKQDILIGEKVRQAALTDPMIAEWLARHNFPPARN